MMRKLTALLIAFLVGSSGVPANSTEQTAGTKPADLSVQLGRTDFLNYCAACHGVGGKGDGTVAEFINIDVADLTQLRKKNNGLFPRERVTEVIDGRIEVKVHGPRDMPVWGDWFRREAASAGAVKGTQEEIVGARIKSLIDYIETIQEK